MAASRVTFILNDNYLTIYCSEEDRMIDICQNYSKNIKKNYNSLKFMYRGLEVNFELKFKDQIYSIDRKSNEIKVLVYIKEEDSGFDYSKSEETENITNNSKINSMNNHSNINADNCNIKTNHINSSANNNFQMKDVTKQILDINLNGENKFIDLNHNCINNGNNIDSKGLILKIRSKYIRNKVFSNLEEKRKLKTIKYNNMLKNEMDIKLLNYKFYSGKYIIFGDNGEGKEYFGYNDELFLEGLFVNGEILNPYIVDLFYFKNENGLTKEYFDGILEYEGEYLHGKRNGRGREFYSDGKLKFEGEYLNGERNGKGKEFYNGKLLFEGEYLNGKRNGKGVEYYDNDKFKTKENYLIGEKWFRLELNDKIEFEGEYLNGKRWNGKGKEYHDNGKLEFEGEYLNGEINGKGKGYSLNGKLVYEGEYLFDKIWNGKGYDKNGNIIMK